MSPALRVECNKKDCAFYTTRDNEPVCYCTHPNKRHHLIEDNCPLYRPDWSKSANQIDKFKRIRRRNG
jgi:hemolysin-activating ACP:hemolysin acyltransferase